MRKGKVTRDGTLAFHFVEYVNTVTCDIFIIDKLILKRKYAKSDSNHLVSVYALK
jgi:hypothetical protein